MPREMVTKWVHFWGGFWHTKLASPGLGRGLVVVSSAVWTGHGDTLVSLSTFFLLSLSSYINRYFPLS